MPVDPLKEALDKLTTQIQKTNGSLGDLEGVINPIKGFTPVLIVLSLTLKSLLAGITTGFKVYQNSIKVQRDYDESIRTTNKLLADSNDIIGNTNQQTFTAMMLLNRNIENLSPELVNLIRQQQLTGQNIERTLDLQLRFENILGLSEKATTRLASRTLDLAETYKVQTSYLVETMQSLEDSMRPISLIGGNTGAINEAIAEIAAEGKRGTEELLDSFTKSIIRDAKDPAKQGLMRQLGLGDLIDAIQNPQSEPTTIRDLMVKSFTDLNRITKDFAGDQLYALGIIENIAGQYLEAGALLGQQEFTFASELSKYNGSRLEKTFQAIEDKISDPGAGVMQSEGGISEIMGKASEFADTVKSVQQVVVTSLPTIIGKISQIYDLIANSWFFKKDNPELSVKMEEGTRWGYPQTPASNYMGIPGYTQNGTFLTNSGEIRRDFNK